MYVFYPFFSKTFWAGVDDTEAKAEQKLHQYPRFWKEGKAYTVEIILPGKE